MTPTWGLAAGCAEFDHPFVQALGMFLGEAMCMLAFKVLHPHPQTLNP